MHKLKDYRVTVMVVEYLGWLDNDSQCSAVCPPLLWVVGSWEFRSSKLVIGQIKSYFGFRYKKARL